MKLLKVLLTIGILLFSITSNAEVSRKGDDLLFQSDINDVSVLKVILNYSKKPFKRLVLSSNGGEFEAGMKLAQFVMDKDINVYVPEYCSSACTFAFFAANNKDMSNTSYLALHNVSLMAVKGTIKDDDVITVKDAIDLAQIAVINSGEMLSLYSQAGIPSDILFDISRSVGNNVVTLKKQDLLVLGILKK